MKHTNINGRMKALIKRICKSILCQPRRKVVVNIGQVDWHRALLGQRIVVTGGSKGMGLAMARKFVAEGARVLITGRNEQRLKEVVADIGQDNAAYLVCDHETMTDYDGFIQECIALLGGGVDCLVLNAGISLHEGNILNVTPEGFDRQFNINLRASYFMAQAFVKQKLVYGEEGNVLFLSSETAGKCIDIPYGLTKVAINSLVGGLGRRVYKRGIRVNAIAPGVTYTDLTSGGTVIDDDYARPGAAGRWLLPEEMAEVACFLLCYASKCITGEVIYCDAGSHLKINGDESDYSL